MVRRLLFALGVALVFAVPALADHGHGKGREDRRAEHVATTIFESQVAPTIPTDPVVHGVTPGGAPWVIHRGSIELSSNGRLEVEVVGLVIPTAPQNGTNPVPALAASLFCGDSTTPVATTHAFPFDGHGNAEIEATIPLHGKCLAPAVLLNPNGNAGVYIAASGFGG